LAENPARGAGRKHIGFGRISLPFTSQNSGRPKARKSLRRRLLTALGPMLFVAVVAAVVLFFVQGAMSYNFDDGPASQFYAGGSYNIPQGAVMRREEDVSIISYSSVTRDAVNLPIYCADGRVVLPDDMAYYDPRGNFAGKADYFAELRLDAYGVTAATRGSASRDLSMGFLYDGEDTYLFLEPVTIRFNGYRIELSAMSYAEAVYDGTITLYDRESGEFTIEAPTGNALCESVAGDYVISLLSDYFEKADGTRLLLFTKPELLDSCFG
jgi:hypothetical protein